ncbi:MAG: hypothetical protein RR386_02915 [Bacteroidaceae bacterium]
MQKPSPGSKKFGLFVGYYMTWQYALTLDTFDLRTALFLLWYSALCFVSTVALSYLVELLRKRPLFGVRETAYFPFRKALYLAIPIVAILMMFSYYTVDHAQIFTTQRIITYLLGYLVGIAVVVYYVYGLKAKK